jgi:uncharacterized caspase-like protein
MQAMPVKNFIILFILFLIYPCSSIAATQQRIALVIGNSAYSSGHLKNPVNDATDMATALKKTGFSVTLKKNANLREMLETIEDFGNTLKRGGTGLFYYAGHGVQVGGANYLLPIGTRINKEGDVRYEAVDVGRILTEMETANNGLNIVILDACRDNPFGNTFRSSSRGLSIVTHAPTGTFISYSTGAGQVARDGEGRNSPYTKALLENISKPGLTINKVFMNVRSRVLKSTGQVPWELSSLVGDFYFIPPKGTTASTQDETITTTQTAGILDEEKQNLAAERQRLEQEKAALARQKELAMARPPVSRGNEIKRDNRFIAYDNGTVLDTRTNLMWATKDNGYDINWSEAKLYCENYRGGGYTDWRMPMQDELANLYDSDKRNRDGFFMTNLIQITKSCLWASENDSYNAGIFHFSRDFWDNHKDFDRKSHIVNNRVLPVRTPTK